MAPAARGRRPRAVWRRRRSVMTGGARPDLSAVDPATAELTGAIIDPAQALVIAAALGLVVRDD
jgi:hypothetical protein